MKLNIENVKDKADAMERLKGLAQCEGLDPFVQRALKEMGWEIFINGAIPMKAAEFYLREVLADPSIKSVLVIGSNRGVAPALISTLVEKVTHLINVETPVRDRLYRAVGTKNITVKYSESFDYVNAKYLLSYDMVFCEVKGLLERLDGARCAINANSKYQGFQVWFNPDLVRTSAGPAVQEPKQKSADQPSVQKKKGKRSKGAKEKTSTEAEPFQVEQSDPTMD